MFSETDMCGKSASDWKTTANSRSKAGTPRIDVPPISTSPRSGSIRPATIRRTVVFPDPEGPRRVKNSPSRMLSDTSSRAATSPNVFETSRSSTIVLASVFDAPSVRHGSGRDLILAHQNPRGVAHREEVSIPLGDGMETICSGIDCGAQRPT